MPGISGQTFIQGQDNGVTVVQILRTLNIIGAVVTVGANGLMNVDVSGVGGFMLTDFSNAVPSANDIDFGGFKGVNAADPVNPQELATKAYVDGASPSSAWLVAGNAAGGDLGTTVNADVRFLRNNIEHGRMSGNGWDWDQLSYQMIYGSNSFFFGTGASTGILTATGVGAFAHGFSNLSVLSANADGSHASGYVSAGGSISVIGGSLGSHAFGYCDAGAHITAQGAGGSLAFGYCIAPAGVGIIANGRGSFAGGYCTTQNVFAIGDGSFAWGDFVTTNANYSFGFGFGIANNSYVCLASGRYCENLGSGASNWVATDPLFMLGNGTSDVARANAFQVDKDGKVKTTGAHRNTAIRVVALAAAISARTDRTIVCDSTGAGGNLTLPAGEDGLEFIFTGSGAGAAIYTVVPSGLDVLDVNVVAAIAAGVVTRIQFLGGTWYAV